MSTVNIVMSAYNGETYIREQISSIMNSFFKDFTLFVCDDGSSDLTCSIVEEFISEYGNKIVLLKNEHNMGSTASFLSNLKMINEKYPAKYYMFADQDDIWLMDKIGIGLKAMYKFEHRLRRNKRALPILVFNDAIIVDSQAEFLSRSFYKTNKLKVHKTEFNRMLMENKCIGCTMLMNKPLVDLLGEIGPDIRYHDWWMALIASAFGIVRYVKVPTLLYRQHGSNQVGQSSFNEYVSSRASKKQDVKERLNETYKQAEFFKKVYGGRLKKMKLRRLNSFIKLGDSGFWRKRYLITKNRFFKSGFIRNIGLYFYI